MRLGLFLLFLGIAAGTAVLAVSTRLAAIRAAYEAADLEERRMRLEEKVRRFEIVVEHRGRRAYLSERASALGVDPRVRGVGE